MHCRWYPSMPCSRSWGVVSQHALQFSRPTPRGKLWGIWPGGVSRPTHKGEVEGDLARGVSRPTPKGEVVGDQPGGGLQAHTKGGSCGGSGQGGLQAQTRQGCLVPGGSAPGGWMATAAGCTHPIGMHSCYKWHHHWHQSLPIVFCIGQKSFVSTDPVVQRIKYQTEDPEADGPLQNRVVKKIPVVPILLYKYFVHRK